MTDLEAVRSHVEILTYVKQRMAELKELQEASRSAVAEALGDSETGELDGQPVITYKHITSTRLDQSKLREEYPRIMDKCMHTTVSRRMEIL